MAGEQDEPVTIYLEYATCICIILMILSELRVFISLGWRYFSSIQTVVSVVSLPLIAFAILPAGHDLCLHHWRCLIIGVTFLGISNCMVFLRIDLVGLYFSMFFEVMRGVLKVSCLLVFFMFTFTVPLSIMLRTQDGFHDFPTPLTTLAMTLGELNFRDNFIRADNRPFTIDVYIFFPLFSIILPVIVVNLMIGVAVGDINKIEKEAYLLRIKNQIGFLKNVELSLPSSARRRLHTKTLTIQPNALRGTVRGQILRLLLSDDRIEFIDKEDSTEANDDLREEIKKQNLLIEKLQEVVVSMQSELRNFTK